MGVSNAKKTVQIIIGADTVVFTNADQMQFMLDCNRLMRDASVMRKSESEINGIPRPAYDSAILRAAIEGVRV